PSPPSRQAEGRPARLLPVRAEHPLRIGPRKYSCGVPEERDFDLSAASLRASGGDLQTFVDVLAGKLDDALPGRVKVQRRAIRLLSKQKQVTAIELDLGDTR